MKKLIAMGVTLIAAFTLAACGNSKSANTTPKADYPTATKFESALNNNKTVKGKTVQFKVKKIEPDSAFGYNLEAGKHLNFVSEGQKDVKTGDTVTATVKKTTTTLGSWIITYSSLKKNGKKVADKAVDKSSAKPAKNSTTANGSKTIPTDAKHEWFFQDPVFYAGNETMTLEKSEIQNSATEGVKNIVIYASILNNSDKEQDPSNFVMVIHAKQKTDTSNVDLDMGVSPVDDNGNDALQQYEDNFNNSLLPHKEVKVVLIYALKNANPVTVEFSNANFDTIGTKTYKVQ